VLIIHLILLRSCLILFLWESYYSITLHLFERSEVTLRYIVNWSMSCACHDSLAYEVMSWPMVRPYRYNIASYVAWGGVQCGFIPLEVWRQKSCALHSYAFMKYIDNVIYSLSLLKLQLAAMFWLRIMYFIPTLYLAIKMNLWKINA
jgi:hypothetical protein